VNVGTGRETDVNTLAAHLIRLSGAAVEPVYAPAKAGEQRRSVLDVSRASRELGWTPEVRFEEGLRLTFEWFRTRGS
jgi:nucleoside-diphosphate-sugar epimerase